ncbi:hypothetical protein NN561_000327 [Cricetulus griseus]
MDTVATATLTSGPAPPCTAAARRRPLRERAALDAERSCLHPASRLPRLPEASVPGARLLPQPPDPSTASPGVFPATASRDPTPAPTAGRPARERRGGAATPRDRTRPSPS